MRHVLPFQLFESQGDLAPLRALLRKRFRTPESIVKRFNGDGEHYFHVGDDDSLVISKVQHQRGGQMGQGFYASKEPLVWNETLYDGKATAIYLVDTTGLKIHDGPAPSLSQLKQWGLDNGYYSMEVVRRDNGQIVYELDNKTPYRAPTPTAKYKDEVGDYQDSITGKRDWLENLYHKSQGFDGRRAQYSPDGEQIIIWNLEKVKLTNLKDVWAGMVPTT